MKVRLSKRYYGDKILLGEDYKKDMLHVHIVTMTGTTCFVMGNLFNLKSND